MWSGPRVFSKIPSALWWYVSAAAILPLAEIVERRGDLWVLRTHIFFHGPERAPEYRLRFAGPALPCDRHSEVVQDRRELEIFGAGSFLHDGERTALDGLAFRIPSL